MTLSRINGVRRRATIVNHRRACSVAHTRDTRSRHARHTCVRHTGCVKDKEAQATHTMHTTHKRGTQRGGRRRPLSLSLSFSLSLSLPLSLSLFCMLVSCAQVTSGTREEGQPERATKEKGGLCQTGRALRRKPPKIMVPNIGTVGTVGGPGSNWVDSMYWEKTLCA